MSVGGGSFLVEQKAWLRPEDSLGSLFTLCVLFGLAKPLYMFPRVALCWVSLFS